MQTHAIITAHRCRHALPPPHTHADPSPPPPPPPPHSPTWNMMLANRKVGANWPIMEGDWAAGCGYCAISTSHPSSGRPVSSRTSSRSTADCSGICREWGGAGWGGGLGACACACMCVGGIGGWGVILGIDWSLEAAQQWHRRQCRWLSQLPGSRHTPSMALSPPVLPLPSQNPQNFHHHKLQRLPIPPTPTHHHQHTRTRAHTRAHTHTAPTHLPACMCWGPGICP